MAHPLVKVFGEYHIHAQRGGGEGGVPAATGLFRAIMCMRALMYRRGQTTFAASVLFRLCLSAARSLRTVIYGPYGKSLWACEAQLTLVNMQ